MQTIHNLNALRDNSEPVMEYISAPREAREAFTLNLEDYKLDPVVIEKLKDYSGRATVFVFSAEWCKDCKKNVPALKLIQDATGIEVRVLGHIMRDARHTNPSTPKEKWKIPPSPPEMLEFNVFKIPYIAVLDEEGKELGAIIENPPEGVSVEEALLGIIEAP